MGLEISCMGDYFMFLFKNLTTPFKNFINPGYAPTRFDILSQLGRYVYCKEADRSIQDPYMHFELSLSDVRHWQCIVQIQMYLIVFNFQSLKSVESSRNQKLYGKLRNHSPLAKSIEVPLFLYKSYCQCIICIQEKRLVYQVTLKSSTASFVNST